MSLPVRALVGCDGMKLRVASTQKAFTGPIMSREPVEALVVYFRKTLFTHHENVGFL
jgi:hypothetical protein